MSTFRFNRLVFFPLLSFFVKWIHVSSFLIDCIVQVGKGRDVGLNQIALFEGKVAGGNGEQVLSRDVYRLGQLLDFFRMCSYFFTTVGYYVCTMVRFLLWSLIVIANNLNLLSSFDYFLMVISS